MEKKIPVVVIKELEDTSKILNALRNYGITTAEITFRTACAEEAIKFASENFKDFNIGAGTVIRPDQVDLTASVGGRFIVSPDTSAAVIKRTKALGLASLPGALTPSEAATAHRAGADFVKLFPISTMGAAYLKAIRAPLSHIKFLAVGGVRLENMADYLAAGAAGFGIGVTDADKKALAEGNYEAIEEKCRTFVSLVKGKV